MNNSNRNYICTLIDLISKLFFAQIIFLFFLEGGVEVGFFYTHHNLFMHILDQDKQKPS